MQTGKVVTWDDKKGFGFIRPDQGGEERFIHYSNIVSDDKRKSLTVGQKVEFDVDDGPTGRPQAVNVVVQERTVA